MKQTLKRNFGAVVIMATASLLLSSCRVLDKGMGRYEANARKSIVVLYDNDVHCAIEGYQKAAGLRDAIQDTAFCIMVSSGDYLQGGTAGAISNGQYVADIMKTVDYAAITLGNHEFDYGMTRMKELLKDIGAPVTCCNLYSVETGKKEYASYVTKQVGNKNIAFVGAVTPTTLYTEAYSFYDKNDRQTHHLSEKNLYQEVQKAVNAARQNGADYVVLLSHIGEDDNICHTMSHELVKQTNGIDVVLDGHTHSVVPQVTEYNKDGKPVIITQTGTKYANVGKLLIQPDGKMCTELIPMKSLTKKNTKVEAATEKVMKEYNAKVQKHICNSDVELNILDARGKQAVRLREVNAGDLVTDAYRYVTNTQIAITNGGGIRTSLKSGNLTYGDIIALLPYENYVEILEVKGQKIIDVLNACTKFLPLENGDFPQVSGIRYTIDMNAQQRVSKVEVLDEKTGKYSDIDPNATYTLGTIDYCVTGGGLQTLLKNEKVVKQNIMLYSEALIEYVTKKLNGHIGQEYASPQGRIIFKQ